MVVLLYAIFGNVTLFIHVQLYFLLIHHNCIIMITYFNNIYIYILYFFIIIFIFIYYIYLLVLYPNVSANFVYFLNESNDSPNLKRKLDTVIVRKLN